MATYSSPADYAIPSYLTTSAPATNNLSLLANGIPSITGGIPNLSWLLQLLGGGAASQQTAAQPFGFTAPTSGAANPFGTLASTVPRNMFMNQAAADIYNNAMGAPPTGAASTDPAWAPVTAPVGGIKRQLPTVPARRFAAMASPTSTSLPSSTPTAQATANLTYSNLASLINNYKSIASPAQTQTPLTTTAQGATAYSGGSRGPASSPATALAGIGGLAGNGGGQFNISDILARIRGVL